LQNSIVWIDITLVKRASDDWMTVTNVTPARSLRLGFVVLSSIVWAVLGSFYSFPLWLPHFKAMFAMDEVVVNVLGSLLYVASMISFPLLVILKSVVRTSWPVLRRNRLLYCLSPCSAIIGYATLWGTTLYVASSIVASVLLCVGSFFISLATGCAFGVLTSDLISIVFVGWDDTLSGVSNIAYVSGGVLVSSLYYGLQLGRNELHILFGVLCVANIVSLFIMIGLAQLATYLEIAEPIPQHMRDSVSMRKFGVLSVNVTKQPLLDVNNRDDDDEEESAVSVLFVLFLFLFFVRFCFSSFEMKPHCVPKPVRKHCCSPWGWIVQFSFGLKIGIGASFS
jgi:hypothetical protein